ncbi:hypothetical protein HDU91_006636, partial [Kappamyces sp. JEL0680]
AISGNQFLKNKHQKAPKQAIKEASKKAKKLKLDPQTAQTVVDLQQEQAQKQSENADDSETNAAVPVVPMQDPGNASDLKQRLAARIEELRQKRAGSGAGAEPKSRQELLERRRLKKLDRKKALLKKKDSRKMGVDTKVRWHG